MLNKALKGLKGRENYFLKYFFYENILKYYFKFFLYINLLKYLKNMILLE